MSKDIRPELSGLQERLNKTLDLHRDEAREKRHQKGYRTARENLADLVDEGSFLEYGQLAVAAQRNRRSYEDLQSNTPADGILTGLCTINAEKVSPETARSAVVINDYTVVAFFKSEFIICLGNSLL